MSDDIQISDLIKEEHGEKLEGGAEETQSQLTKKLTSISLKNLEKETEKKASTSGFPYINLEHFPISQEAIIQIDERQAESLGLICFFYNGKEIRFGAINPGNPQVKQITTEISTDLHANPEVYLISKNSFQVAYNLYKKIPKIKDIDQGINLTAEELKKYELLSFQDIQKNVNAVNVSEIIAMLVGSAIGANASDIHIEAEREDIKVRFRIDGVLQTVAMIENDKWKQIISRVKLISGLKLNVETEPQDGRISIFLDNDMMDIRVSTIPTTYGESVVMRLLRSSATGLKFEDLGVRGRAQVELNHEVERPNGMIIATGPTGSGKTTTLYAILKKLNDSETKIITLEDPVEYKLTGVNQSQIDHTKDYTFAKGLRSILRQDPDVIMVGEIRDLETAETAINAALTGHLVISTIHTNSAAGAIPRFLAMGVKSFLLSPALNAIIGQRLCRILCPKCKVEDRIDNDTMTKILNILSAIPIESSQKLTSDELNNLKFYKAVGCPQCHNIGYKGRIGIYEILTMTPEIEKMILSNNVSEYQIQDAAVKAGMVTMAQDGLLKAKDGITSIEEVFKVAE